MKIFMDPVLVHLTGHSKQLLVKVLIWKAQVRNKTSAFCSHDSWYTSESLMLIISAYACMAMCSSSRSSITPYPPVTIKTWPLFHGFTINPEAAKMASRLPRWPKHSWNGQRLSGSFSSDFPHWPPDCFDSFGRLVHFTTLKQVPGRSDFWSCSDC